MLGRCNQEATFIDTRPWASDSGHGLTKVSRKRLASAELHQANTSSTDTTSCYGSSTSNVGSWVTTLFHHDLPFASTVFPEANIRMHSPLSPGHHITLMQVNLCSATHLNLALLSPYSSKPTSNLPPLCRSISKHRLPPVLPPSLIPTAVQRAIKHPAWIDAVPLPQMRDSFIAALGTFHYDPLCDDLLKRGVDADGEHKGKLISIH